MRVHTLFVQSIGPKMKWDGMTVELPLYMRYDNLDLNEEQLSSARIIARKHVVSFFQKHKGRMPTNPRFVEQGPQ